MSEVYAEIYREFPIRQNEDGTYIAGDIPGAELGAGTLQECRDAIDKWWAALEDLSNSSRLK